MSTDSFYARLLDQRNVEFTLFNVYLVKAKDEKDPIIKVIYEKLSNDSLSHLNLVENALKILRVVEKKEIPSTTMLKIMEQDPLTMTKKETDIDAVDSFLEEMETAAASYFHALADDFPDHKYVTFFERMAEEEREHQKLLKAIKSYKTAVH